MLRICSRIVKNPWEYFDNLSVDRRVEVPACMAIQISSIFRIYCLKIHGNINFWHRQVVRRNVINLNNLVLKIIKMHYEYTGISIVGFVVVERLVERTRPATRILETLIFDGLVQVFFSPDSIFLMSSHTANHCTTTPNQH